MAALGITNRLDSEGNQASILEHFWPFAGVALLSRQQAIDGHITVAISNGCVCDYYSLSNSLLCLGRSCQSGGFDL